MIASPSPLQWPSSFKQTPAGEKRRGKFQMSFPQALTSLHKAMQKRGLKRHEYVISSNLPLKNNGDPTPVGGHQGVTGIAIYWREPNKPIRVVACDQFWDAAHNIRALALALEHLRDMERWGCTQLVEHIMHGFALPAGEAPPSRPTTFYAEPPLDWIDYFGFTIPRRVIDQGAVDAAYRSRARDLHPDHGGSDAAMVGLNLMRDQAHTWLAWRDSKLR